MAVKVKMFAYQEDTTILETFVKVFVQHRARKTLYIAKLKLMLSLGVPSRNYANPKQLMLTVTSA
jgi:hypothetical protein